MRLSTKVGGWYLRGDIGFTNQIGSLFNANYVNFSMSVNNIDKKGFDASPLFGFGVGYVVNNWLRLDVTGGQSPRRTSKDWTSARHVVAVSPTTATPPASPNSRLIRHLHHAVHRRRRRHEPPHDKLFTQVEKSPKLLIVLRLMPTPAPMNGVMLYQVPRST